jgi:hypothetical protein
MLTDGSLFTGAENGLGDDSLFIDCWKMGFERKSVSRFHSGGEASIHVG